MYISNSEDLAFKLRFFLLCIEQKDLLAKNGYFVSFLFSWYQVQIFSHDIQIFHKNLLYFNGYVKVINVSSKKSEKGNIQLIWKIKTVWGSIAINIVKLLPLNPQDLFPQCPFVHVSKYLILEAFIQLKIYKHVARLDNWCGICFICKSKNSRIITLVSSNIPFQPKECQLKGNNIRLHLHIFTYQHQRYTR